MASPGNEQYEKWGVLDQQIAQAIRTGDHQLMDALANEITAGTHGWLARLYVSNYHRTHEAVKLATQSIDVMRKRLSQFP